MSLRAENVSLVLGDGSEQVQALADVSLSVQPGELLAIVGPSGAGKSSLLAVCGALRTPTSGRIWIGGEEITGRSRSELATVRRERLGFVFQQSNLVPALTSLDQLLLVPHLRGQRPGAAERERAMRLLDAVGMAGRVNHRPAQLSGGERQRIGIARALMGAPAVLLVDEPTSMLDHPRGRKVVELLRQQGHEHGVGTLMVTHDEELLGVVDRWLRIRDGRVGETGGKAHVAAAN